MGPSGMRDMIRDESTMRVFTRSVCPARRRYMFVRGGAVDRRHGNVIHAQINAELRAMMNHVVHDHGAKHGDARHCEDWLAAVRERPWRHQSFRRWRPHGSAANFGHVLIEECQNFGACLQIGRLHRWPARRIHVETRDVSSVILPSRNRGNVRGQRAHDSSISRAASNRIFRPGTRSRLLRGVGHLVIEFPQQSLIDCISLRSCWNCSPERYQSRIDFVASTGPEF